MFSRPVSSGDESRCPLLASYVPGHKGRPRQSGLGKRGQNQPVRRRPPRRDDHAPKIDLRDQIGAAHQTIAAIRYGVGKEGPDPPIYQ